MGILYTAVGLLHVFGLIFGQECKRELLKDTDFPGSDIQMLFSPDAEHCQHLCTQHPTCRFFTHNSNFNCYLKATDSGRPASKTTVRGVTSGFSLKQCKQDPLPCLSEVYENLDFPGADYRVLFTADYEECQRVCTQDPHCQFFTFVKRDYTLAKIRYKCHLKFSWTIPRLPIVERKAGATSGFSHNLKISPKLETECQNMLFPNTDIPGSDVEILQDVSPEHCQVLCSAHPQCTYFTFFGEKCFLKNNPNEMVTKPFQGATSGLPAYFCNLGDCWLKKAHEGVDFRGSDISFELMDDADTCQRKCTGNPNCQFYTYVDESFVDRAYRRRCYLKRVITVPAPPKVSKLAGVMSGFSLRNCATPVR